MSELPTAGERFLGGNILDESTQLLEIVKAEGRHKLINKKHTHIKDLENSDTVIEARSRLEYCPDTYPYPREAASMIRFRSPDLVATFVFHDLNAGGATVLELTYPDKPNLRPVATLSSSRLEDISPIVDIWESHFNSTELATEN